MKQVKGYLANQFGFSETGNYILDNLIKPRITEIGITINDPFSECGKELDYDRLSSLELYDERMKYWEGFNYKVTPINNRLMEIPIVFWEYLTAAIRLMMASQAK
jgi:hypothetical protein